MVTGMFGFVCAWCGQVVHVCGACVGGWGRGRRAWGLPWYSKNIDTLGLLLRNAAQAQHGPRRAQAASAGRRLGRVGGPGARALCTLQQCPGSSGTSVVSQVGLAGCTSGGAGPPWGGEGGGVRKNRQGCGPTQPPAVQQLLALTSSWRLASYPCVLPPSAMPCGPPTNKRTNNPYRSNKPIKELARPGQVLRTGEAEIIKAAGVDAAMYIKILRMGENEPLQGRATLSCMWMGAARAGYFQGGGRGCRHVHKNPAHG